MERSFKEALRKVNQIMKVTKKAINFVLSIIIVFALMLSFATTIKADSYFDTWYGAIPWKEEAIRLDSFVVFLLRNPEAKAYIAFYVGEKESYEEVKSRISRAAKHMVKTRKLDKKRLVIVYAGRRQNTTIILHYRHKDLPPPEFGFSKNKIVSSEFKYLND
jgi:nucleosome binding factor SPN SPT16 subunit